MAFKIKQEKTGIYIFNKSNFILRSLLFVLSFKHRLVFNLILGRCACNRLLRCFWFVKKMNLWNNLDFIIFYHNSPLHIVDTLNKIYREVKNNALKFHCFPVKILMNMLKACFIELISVFFILLQNLQLFVLVVIKNYEFCIQIAISKFSLFLRF